MRRLLLCVFLCGSACGGCNDNPLLDEFTLETCDNAIDDNEDGLTDCEDDRCQLDEACSFVPPDPSAFAPPRDPTDLIDFADSVRFLYEGENAVVRGVQPGALDESRIGVIRARVMGPDGEPIQGVRYNIANKPRFGYTFSRDDGKADLVANGGESVTVRAEAPGFLPVDRTLELTTLDIDQVEDIVLTPLDENITRIKKGGLASGTPRVDEDGERAVSLYVPSGTVATVRLADGQEATLSKFNVRLTEYTVGENGPAAMPAELPENSA